MMTASQDFTPGCFESTLVELKYVIISDFLVKREMHCKLFSVMLDDSNAFTPKTVEPFKRH